MTRHMRQQHATWRVAPARQRRRRLIGRVAALALLFQVLVPSYAMAALAPPGEGLIPICTASGIIWISLSGEEAPGTPAPQPDKPCHFCFAKNGPLSFAAVPQLLDLPGAFESKISWRLVSAQAKPRHEGPAGIRAPPASASS